MRCLRARALFSVSPCDQQRRLPRLWYRSGVSGGSGALARRMPAMHARPSVCSRSRRNARPATLPMPGLPLWPLLSPFGRRRVACLLRMRRRHVFCRGFHGMLQLWAWRVRPATRRGVPLVRPRSVIFDRARGVHAVPGWAGRSCGERRRQLRSLWARPVRGRDWGAGMRQLRPWPVRRASRLGRVHAV